jgi:hypothetical protein
MAGGDDQEEGDDGEDDRPPRCLPRQRGGQPAEAEEEQGVGSGSGGDAVAGVEDQPVAEGPAAGAEERPGRSHPEVDEEEVGREKGQEGTERHLVRPGLRERQEAADPGRRMEDRRLLHGEERLAG